MIDLLHCCSLYFESCIEVSIDAAGQMLYFLHVFQRLLHILLDIVGMRIWWPGSKGVLFLDIKNQIDVFWLEIESQMSKAKIVASEG